jgi:hypothetical protein
MLTGAHVIINSVDPEVDRAFLKDVLGLAHVDAGRGWLIFGLPPAEVAVHPAGSASHELYLMCDDIAAFVAEMNSKGVACGAPEDLGWGILATVSLPGGGTLGVYEPRHARPVSAPPAKPARAARKPAAKKRPAAKKKPAAPKKVAKKKAGRPRRR